MQHLRRRILCDQRDGQATSGHSESPSAVIGMDGRRVWVQSSETRRQRKDYVERGRELADSPRLLTLWRVSVLP